MSKSNPDPNSATGSYEQVRQIVSGALDAVVTINREGRVVEWNKRAEEVFGWARDEALGQLMAEMIVPHAMREAHNRGMSHYLATGEGPILNQRIEITALRRDGDEFPVELSVTPLQIGDELRFSAFIRDITEERAARSSLEEATQLLETLIDGLNSAVMVEDNERRILHVNSQFCALFDIPLSSSELVGTDCRAGLDQSKQIFAHPQKFLDKIDQLIAAGTRATNHELELVDGRVLELDYVPIGLGEHSRGHLWHYRDISERKLAAAALAERNAQLDSIFSLSPDGFASIDADGCIRFVNPAFEHLTGLAISSIRGARIAQLDSLLMQQADPELGYTSMIELLGAPGRKGDYEDVMYLMHPRHRILKRVVRQATDLSGEQAGQVIYLRDITHEAEVDRMKSEFLSTAAHELRTPMASVYGFSELLLMRDYDKETSHEIVETIHNQSKRLINMLNELLDLARIEARAGKDFEFALQEVEPIIRHTVKSLMIPGDNRPVKSTFRRKLPAVLIDRDKIEQALTNVLANAYKYSPDGGDITLRTFSQEVAGRTYVTIVITDQGIGMTPDQLEKVFERFYRADISGNIPGTGLGMCLVKEIIELHGGDIFVESEYGKGTSVSMLLPVSSEQDSNQLTEQRK